MNDKIKSEIEEAIHCLECAMGHLDKDDDYIREAKEILRKLINE